LVERFGVPDTIVEVSLLAGHNPMRHDATNTLIMRSARWHGISATLLHLPIHCAA
jgi:hypothetical protein